MDVSYPKWCFPIVYQEMVVPKMSNYSFKKFQSKNCLHQITYNIENIEMIIDIPPLLI